MAKAAKPVKPSKAEKQQRKQLENMNPFATPSILKHSQQYMKETPDAKPFQDMALMVLIAMAFFIWRLSVAVKSKHDAAIGVWGLFTFGSAFIINVWTFILVMVTAKRRGDIGLLRIVEDDILHFTGISGVIGAWVALILFRFKPEDRLFFPKILVVSIFNVLWVALYVRYYL